MFLPGHTARYRDHQPSPALLADVPRALPVPYGTALSPHQLNFNFQLSTSLLFSLSLLQSAAAHICPPACTVAKCAPVARAAICIHRLRPNHFLPSPRLHASPSWSSESAISVTVASRRRSTSSAMNGRVSSATLLDRALLIDIFRHQRKTLRV